MRAVSVSFSALQYFTDEVLDAELPLCQKTRLLMTKRIFTTKAEMLWRDVSAGTKAQILKNVFCTKSKSAVELVDYTGTEDNGNVVLEGLCARCGNRIVRVVEIPKASPPKS